MFMKSVSGSREGRFILKKVCMFAGQSGTETPRYGTPCEHQQNIEQMVWGEFSIASWSCLGLQCNGGPGRERGRWQCWGQRSLLWAPAPPSRERCYRLKRSVSSSLTSKGFMAPGQGAADRIFLSHFSRELRMSCLLSPWFLFRKKKK